MTFLWHHSHKKQKDSLETQTVYIEIYLTSWNLLNIPKRRGSNLRNIASSEGSHLVAGAFHVIVDKIEADILQIAKKWNWKWIVKHTFQKDPSYEFQFCTKVCAPSRLLSEVWAKHKDVPTKILKRDARTDSSCQKLKICVWTVQTS